MKFIPINIKYIDTHKNKVIRNKTEIIGLIDIMTNTPLITNNIFWTKNKYIFIFSYIK